MVQCAMPPSNFSTRVRSNFTLLPAARKESANGIETVQDGILIEPSIVFSSMVAERFDLLGLLVVEVRKLISCFAIHPQQFVELRM